MATKKKDNKGPATQSTGTQGVNAVGVNHGTKPNYAPGFTDVAGSPSYQQYGQQYPQQAPVVVQPAQQQVQPQTATNVQQNPVVQPAQTAPTGNVVQPAPQQIVLPNQITMPGGRVINMQPQQQATAPMKIGNNTYQVPTGQVVQPTPEETSARQQQINTDYALDNGVAPNAVRPHGDIQEPEAAKQAREQVETSQANAQERAAASQASDEDEYQKTLKEYLDSKYESPEDREQREKREARQRRWAAISEGLANVFNVGGAVAGAQPAQWKSGVGDLYANQEAESDKRRLEYRQALKDLIDYRTAIRNGDIAQARAIEERRRNDFYERKMLEDIASKQANDELKRQKQEADEKRKDQEAKNKQRAADDKHEEHVDKKARGYTTARSSSGGGKGRGRSGGSKSTGAAAAKSAKAAAKRRAKAATQGTKFGKK